MNDDLEAAVDDEVHIICTVRCRTMLHKELIDQINATFAEVKWVQNTTKFFNRVQTSLVS